MTSTATDGSPLRVRVPPDPGVEPSRPVPRRPHPVGDFGDLGPWRASVADRHRDRVLTVRRSTESTPSRLARPEPEPTPEPGPEPEPTPEPDRPDQAFDHRALGALESQIARDHPEAAPSEIRALITAHLARTADARVQHYRLLLAERAVRSHLRSRRTTGHVPTGRHPGTPMAR